MIRIVRSNRARFAVDAAMRLAGEEPENDRRWFSAVGWCIPFPPFGCDPPDHDCATLCNWWLTIAEQATEPYIKPPWEREGYY